MISYKLYNWLLFSYLINVFFKVFLIVLIFDFVIPLDIVTFPFAVVTSHIVVSITFVTLLLPPCSLHICCCHLTHCRLRLSWVNVLAVVALVVIVGKADKCKSDYCTVVELLQ